MKQTRKAWLWTMTGILAMSVSSCNRTPAVVGDWNGMVTIGPTSLPINLHIAKAEEGDGLTGTIQSPRQAQQTAPLVTSISAGTSLSFR